MGHVQELTGEHVEETPLSCTPAQREWYMPACDLTRDRARTLMRTRLEEAELQVHDQEGQRGDLTFTNLFAELPGTTPHEEIVLVGAHFDAHYMGADDNWTGVAGVLELARVLSQYRFERTLRFVGFGLEELGDVGSGHYVDMIGDEKLVATVIFQADARYLLGLGNAVELRAREDFSGGEPGLPRRW